MNAFRSMLGVMALLAGISGIGCAGARTTLEAPDAQYPVSLTRGIRGADGELVPVERREVVGKFRDTRTAWAILYSGVNITPTKDLSEAINEQIAARGGDAIVHLRVGSADCALNWFAILNLLPIWPGCTNIYVEGDIIRVKPALPTRLTKVASRTSPRVQ
jgi:hypothetical protein